MAGLLDIFGGGSADPYDIYGDLFTEKQKAAMRSQQQGQGLLRMAGAFADAAMPSRTPIPFGAALGKAAAALGSGQDAQMEQMLKAAQTAELVRQSQQTRAMQKQFEPLYAELLRRIRAQGAPAPNAAPAPTGVSALPSAPAATTAPFSIPDVPSFGGALGATPAAAGGAPGAGASLDNDPTQLAGLLATPDAGALAQLAAGGPDQVVGQGPGKLQGLLSAAYAPGGGANGRLPFGQDDGTPTVRLASAALAPYAIGNAVMGGPSSVEGVSDALSQKITDMVAKMPPDIAARFKIISGYRDSARQAQVNPGAPNSRHGAGTGPPGTGMAVDLESDPAVLDWITKNQNTLGVGFPLAADPKERNHLEMLTAEGARLGGSARRGGRFAGMGPDAGGGGGQDLALGQLAALSTLTGLLGVPGFPDLSSFLKSTSGLGSGSGSGSSVAPSNSGDVLDSVVAPLESGNRNIMQQVVGPGGGYNPSVGRVTGPSTAGGYYQITNSTWQDTAPKAGVDLARYPTAISAPREVQKQVAQQLLDTRGLQPWADFNPAVAAATGYRRGGRFAGMGPATGGGVGGGETDLTGLLQLMSGPGGLSLPAEPPATYGSGVLGQRAAPTTAGALPNPAAALALPPAPAPAPAPAAAPTPAAPGMGRIPTLGPIPTLSGPPGAGVIPGLGVKPEELAVLNAMAEMAKLGTPFKGLLETYYKSPEYLQQAAGAGALGTLPFDIYKQQSQSLLAIKQDMAKDNMTVDDKGNIVLLPEAQRIRTMNAEQIAAAQETWKARLGTPIEATVRGPDGVTPTVQKMTPLEFAQRQEAAAKRPGDPRPGDIVGTPYYRPGQAEQETAANAPQHLGPTDTVVYPPGSVGASKYQSDKMRGQALPDNVAIQPDGSVRVSGGYTPGQVKTQESAATNTQTRINSYQEAANAAQSAKTTLQGISGEIGKVVTGPFADYAQNAALYLNTIAPGFSGQVKAYEDMASQANELVRKAVRASDPNPSFVQTRMAMDSMPTPSKSEGGLYKITNRMIGLQDYDIARGNATQMETPGGAEKFDSWWRQNVSPYAFVFAKLAPDDRDSLINTLQKTAQGKRELETIGKQLQFIEQHGGFGVR